MTRRRTNLQDRLDEIEEILFQFNGDLEEEDAEDWLFYRFEVEDVKAYLECGVTNPHAAAVIDDEGLSPKKLAALMEKKKGPDPEEETPAP